MTGRSRIVTIAALGVGLAAVAAVILLTTVVQQGADATSQTARTSTPSETPASPTEFSDATLVVPGETPRVLAADQASAALPTVEAEPLRLSRVCPFVGHHAASYELLEFLTSVDKAIFALDGAIGHLALLADGTLRGHIEPVRLIAASGAMSDALLHAPALGPHDYSGPALYAQQFKLLRSLALTASETQSRLIRTYAGGLVEGAPGAPVPSDAALHAVVGLVQSLDRSVEYRDNVIQRLLPFVVDRPRTC